MRRLDAVATEWDRELDSVWARALDPVSDWGLVGVSDRELDWEWEWASVASVVSPSVDRSDPDCRNTATTTVGRRNSRRAGPAVPSRVRPIRRGHTDRLR